MSNPHRSYLPPEILDHTVDFLHDQPESLKQCCLVSSSWIPRARRHLFADVEFRDRHHLERWKKVFPGPTKSPAYYTRNLAIYCLWAVPMEDSQEGGWLLAFSRVVELLLDLDSALYSRISLVPLHKFSPSIKSLRVVSFVLLPPYIFHLVRSLPLLENLALNGNTAVERNLPPASDLSTSPNPTGTLKLALHRGVEAIARRLIDLPNGLRFRKLILSWSLKEEIRWMDELVAACSDTLECLDVKRDLFDGPWPSSLDLSRATKLGNAIFRPVSHVRWIITALRTITPRHRDFRRISIDITHDLLYPELAGNTDNFIRGQFYQQWMELDRLLVEFWESRSIRLGVMPATMPGRVESTEDCCRYLLPGMAKRGIIDLVERY